MLKLCFDLGIMCQWPPNVKVTNTYMETHLHDSSLPTVHCVAPI